MGNMLPRLVHARSSPLPPMKAQHWSRSMKLLARTLRRATRRPRRNMVGAAAAASAMERLPGAAQATARGGRARARSSSSRNGQSRRVVRVKVVLTRAEAALLLSLTAHGDRTAAEVVGELKRMQVTRATAAAAAAAWRPALDSIPEEWH